MPARLAQRMEPSRLGVDEIVQRAGRRREENGPGFEGVHRATQLLRQLPRISCLPERDDHRGKPLTSPSQQAVSHSFPDGIEDAGRPRPEETAAGEEEAAQDPGKTAPNHSHYSFTS